MNRHTSSAARLAGSLAIVAIVVFGCARHAAGPTGQAAGTAPGQTAAAAAASATPTATVQITPDLTAGPTDTAVPTPAAAYSPPAVADDLITTDIQSLDGILKGIDNSLSGADAGSNGGE